MVGDEWQLKERPDRAGDPASYKAEQPIKGIALSRNEGAETSNAGADSHWPIICKVTTRRPELARHHQAVIFNSGSKLTCQIQGGLREKAINP